MSLNNSITSLLKYEVRINSKWDVFCVSLVVIGATAILFTLYRVSFNYITATDVRNVMEHQITSKLSVEDKIQRAMAFYLNNDKEKAYEELTSVLKEAPENPGANQYFGLILADQKRYEEAIGYLEKGIKSEPLLEKLAYIYLGISYYETGQPEKAIDCLKTGVKLDPGSSLGHFYLGLSSKTMGNNTEAKLAFQKAIKLSGNSYPEAQKELIAMANSKQAK